MKQIHYSCLVVFTALLASVNMSAWGQDLPEGFSANSKGTIKIADLSCTPIHFDGKWRTGKFSVDPSFTAASNIANDTWTFNSNLLSKSGQTFQLANTIQSDKANAAIHWQIDAHSDVAVPTKVLAVDIRMPTATYAGESITVDGREVKLPQKGDKQDLYIRDGIKLISIPTEHGTVQIAGKFKLQLSDLRRFNTTQFSMRLYFTPGQKEITDAKLDMNVTIKASDR